MESEQATQYLLLGQMFVVGASAACWAIPASAWDRMDGTFESVILTPASYFHIQVGRTFVWYLSSIASSILASIVLLVIFDLNMSVHLVTHVAVSLFAACFSAYCFALVHGIMVAKWPRTRNIFLGIVSIELSAFTGAVVPTDYWPAPIAALSSFLPITNSLHALRDEIAGTGGSFWFGIGTELMVAVFWSLIAVLVVSRVVNSTRRNGFSV
jgi:ABC-2 type transport system permease protein